MAIKYGKTWWGEQWLGALKNIDYGNRLPRGASYARKGMVREIAFNGKVITAKVDGSMARTYRETIKLKSFDSSQVDKLIDIISSKPIILSKLFNRQLDAEVATMAEKSGMQLFPKQWADLDMECSCPDWAVPCKHLAAVIYKISMEIDNNPFLIFSFHGVDLLSELSKRGIAPSAAEALEIEDLSAVCKEEGKEFDCNIPVSTLDYTLLPDLVQSLPDLLPASPAFYHEGDFRVLYTKELQYVAKRATQILAGKDFLSIPFKETLNRSDVIQASVDSDVILMQKVLDITAERVDDYHQSIAVFRQMLLLCLQLIAHGCVVPQIYKQTEIIKKRSRGGNTEQKSYSIMWHPAMIDKSTSDLVERTGQDYHLLCRLISNLIFHLSHRDGKDAFINMFFCGLVRTFDGIGETSLPGGIRSWLDRYFMQTKCQISFLVDEAEDGFAVNVEIDGITLKDMFEKPEYAEQRTDALKHLAILCDIVSGLDGYINNKGNVPMSFSLQQFAPFLVEILPAVRLLGVKTIMPKSLQQLIKPKVSLKIKSSSKGSTSFISLADMLDFDWRVAVGEECLSVEEFERLLGMATGLIRFKQSYVYMDNQSLAKLQKALASPPKLKPGDVLQAALSGEYFGAKVSLTDDVKCMIDEFTKVDNVQIPNGLNAQLRPYQERGFSWMYKNTRIGFGSIIADDMGLGKTLQVITLLLKLKEDGVLAGRQVMVVVPTGLLFNWQDELRRFAPDLSVAVYHGTLRSLEKTSDYDVIITTYGVVRSDADKIKKLKLYALVIDEAQNIKNSDTAQSKAIRSIGANCFIAMSGTPVENRLSEFWSIIDFTNRGYMGTAKDFAQKYSNPIQKDGDQAVAARFRKITAPFMMRRLKTDKSIISDLPDKIERNVNIQLTADQAALYHETVNECMRVIEAVDGEDSKSLFKRQGLILQMILALKQICNHPAQYLKNGDENPTLSGKAETLLDLVRSIISSNEKVLIFTQFKEMGDMLQRFIKEALDEDAMFYHGGCSLAQRKDMVSRFQNNKNDRVFILSLKAAGTGLNLTAATHVVHYDLWWNPAVEAQATDRAYRIGQHSNVQVHRFISKNTFEEKIDAMIQKKKALADMTVETGENWIGKLSNKELREIFE